MRPSLLLVHSTPLAHSLSYVYRVLLVILCPNLTTIQISLDNLNPADNENYSKTFFEFFKRKLGIPGDRGYITFHDPGRAFMGYVTIISHDVFLSTMLGMREQPLRPSLESRHGKVKAMSQAVYLGQRLCKCNIVWPIKKF